jgi:hypothetical protein
MIEPKELLGKRFYLLGWSGRQVTYYLFYSKFFDIWTVYNVYSGSSLRGFEDLTEDEMKTKLNKSELGLKEV